MVIKAAWIFNLNSRQTEVKTIGVKYWALTLTESRKIVIHRHFWEIQTCTHLHTRKHSDKSGFMAGDYSLWHTQRKSHSYWKCPWKQTNKSFIITLFIEWKHYFTPNVNKTEYKNKVTRLTWCEGYLQLFCLGEAGALIRSQTFEQMVHVVF